MTINAGIRKYRVYSSDWIEQLLCINAYHGKAPRLQMQEDSLGKRSSAADHTHRKIDKELP